MTRVAALATATGSSASVRRLPPTGSLFDGTSPGTSTPRPRARRPARSPRHAMPRARRRRGRPGRSARVRARFRMSSISMSFVVGDGAPVDPSTSAGARRGASSTDTSWVTTVSPPRMPAVLARPDVARHADPALDAHPHAHGAAAVDPVDRRDPRAGCRRRDVHGPAGSGASGRVAQLGLSVHLRAPRAAWSASATSASPRPAE